MPRLTLLLLLALTAVTSVRAQVRLDLTLGPTLTWTEDVQALVIRAQSGEMPVDTTLSFPATVGFQAGFGVTASGGPLGLRLGARLVNAGAVFADGQAFDRSRLDASFLSVGLDLQLRQPVGPVTLVASGGPELRYAVDLSAVDNLQSFRDELEPVSALLNAGAGLRIDLFGTTLGPEVRYALDLTGIGGGEVAFNDGKIQLQEALKVNALLFGIVLGR